MLAAERRELILNQLREDRSVVVGELSRKFDVSEETIRRDLALFEKEGIATKSYGGAVLREDVAAELPFQIRKKHNSQNKRVIGALVAGLVNDGEHLLLDPSTTALYVVKLLREAGKKNITIITNSVEVLMECAEYDGWQVISTGGQMQSEKYALVGPKAIDSIENYHVDKAIISCRGLDIDRGLTDSNVLLSDIKKTMIENASERILVMDSSKFDQICFSKICGTEDIDVLVTDEVPSEAWRGYLQNNGIRCYYQGAEKGE